jgi:acetylornithine deacetylase/succinyl-diaminopimelate desuccinylase-like protein
MMALAQLLVSLHDDEGNVVVEGLTRFDWHGMDISADDFRASADVLDGVRLMGSGSVGTRLWSGPSVSVIGIDTTTVDGSSNVLIPEARAKLSMRIAPGSDPVAELDALVRHVETHVPWDAQVDVRRIDWDLGPPFTCATDGPAYAAARSVMEAAEAEFILWGPEDMARARIHASDDSVNPAEIEGMILAQAFFLQELASLSRKGGS